MKKGAKRRIIVLFGILFIIVGYVIITTFNYWKKIFENNIQTNKLEIKYNELVSNKDNLESDLAKLQDPEYVAKYAREKYLYSKDGERIIKIFEEEQ